MTDPDNKEKSKKVFSRQNVLYGLLIGLLVGIAAVLAGFLEISDHIELMTLDLRYRLRPEIKVLPEVGYVEFDDASLELFGKWPWPRSKQMALVKTLGFYNARAAGYDVFFIEKENVVFHSELLRDFLADGGINKNRADLPMLLNESFRYYDREFVDAVRNAGNIYLAYFSHDPRSSAKGLAGVIKETAENRKLFPDIKKESIGRLEKTFLETKKGLEQAMYKTVDLDAPLPDMIRAARGIGFAQPGYNVDSIVRNYIFFRYYDGHTLYPITMRMLSDIMDFRLSEIEAFPGGHVVLKNVRDYKTGQRKDIKVSIDGNLQSLLNWAGPFDRTFLHIPFAFLNYYYSYNAAKEIVRRHSGKAGYDDRTISLARKLIHSRLVAEEAASPGEADKISGEVVAAQLATTLLDRRVPENEVRKKLQKHFADDLTERVLLSVSAGKKMEKALLNDPSLAFEQFMDNEKGLLSTGGAADSALLQETFKNIKWFAGKGRLKDVQPYYFPPAKTVSSNGKQVLFSPVDLENKIFMIGLTGTHTIDLKPTPFEESAPMVAYHVNALNTILTNQFLSYPPKYYKYAATVLLSLVIGLIGSVFSIPVSFAMTVFVTGGYLAATYRIWVVKGQWLHWATPVEGILLTYLTIIAVQFVKALREKKKVRGIFSAMVSPAVLRVMEENPDKFSLTGERKPATTLFSKIDGIGPVVRAIAPDELTQLLSIYLTPSSEIIMDYDGYIDKYEGHVIMADFGVPLDDADNPWKCAFSTVEQRLDIEAFKYFVFAKYGQNVGVSMGFNYGYVSAGNMGSERKFQYTVMGDPVNVSARFMAANFIYNSTNAITGEDSVPVLGDYVYLRPLDRILLKGKTKPTDIYDVAGWKPDAYLKLRGERSVPGYLGTVWSKCPPEKIFGYYRFWSAKHAQTGHPLAKDIRDFFGNSLDTAKALMSNEWKKELALYNERFGILKATAHPVLGRTDGPPATGTVMEFQDVLEHWTATLRHILGAVKDNTRQGNGNGAGTVTGSVVDIERECTMLLNKAVLFKSRLAESNGPEASEMEDEKIEGVFEEIRRFVPALFSAPSGSDVRAGKLLHVIGEDRKRYAGGVEEFLISLKGRKREYHEMMSVLGAPDAVSLEVMRCVEDGLQFYWQRDWDAALDKFRNALKLAPGEGPAASFIERIEAYKMAPPGKDWQGEFVQTRK